MMNKRLISTFLLLGYSAMLIKIMVLKDLPVIRIGAMRFDFGGTQEGPANLIPFKTILPYLLGEKGWLIAFINLAGNIVLLVPVGFLVPIVFRNITVKKLLVLAVATGFAIEGMQVLLHVGIFDIDDVILNGLGVLLGYWAFNFLTKTERSIKSKKIMITAAIVLVVAALSVLYGVLNYQSTQPDVNFVRGEENGRLPDSSSIEEDSVPQGDDPCNGTGGTGQIVSAGNNTFTLRRRDGVDEIFNLTNQTVIRNSLGPASPADLKTGMRVTVVTLEDHNGVGTASTVLICNKSGTAITQ